MARITGNLREDQYAYFYILLNSSWHDMFQAKVVEKIKTHFSHSVTIFFAPDNLTAYE